MQPLPENAMFGRQSQGQKRGREEDGEDMGTSSFGEHRNKRRIASLPHRSSPSAKREQAFGLNYITTPGLTTITPADSDTEDTPIPQKSAFSPWSSSPAQALSQMSTSSPRINSSQSTYLSDAPIYSDDMEMTDSFHIPPGPSQNEPSPGVVRRIPTPIHNSFTRSGNNLYDPNFADDESLPMPLRTGRRLPSPISEGEPSPSVISDSFGGMQVEVETPVAENMDMQRDTPTKKGHTRSKHSLRNWTGFGETGVSSGGNGGQPKKWSMGYRSDCEKCRNKVPGHFSHVVTC